MIYTVRLANEKYFVNQPLFPVKNVLVHFSNNICKWTDKHIPEEEIDECEDDVATEEKVTLLAMDKYGMNNVRGGPYCNMVLSKSDKSDIQEKINEIYGCNKCEGSHYENLCGQPVEEKKEKVSKKRKIGEVEASNIISSPEQYFIIKSRKPGKNESKYYITDGEGMHVMDVFYKKMIEGILNVVGCDSERSEDDENYPHKPALQMKLNVKFDINDKAVFESIHTDALLRYELTNKEKLAKHLRTKGFGCNEIVYSELTYKAKIIFLFEVTHKCSGFWFSIENFGDGSCHVFTGKCDDPSAITNDHSKNHMKNDFFIKIKSVNMGANGFTASFTPVKNSSLRSIFPSG